MSKFDNCRITSLTNCLIIPFMASIAVGITSSHSEQRRPTSADGTWSKTWESMSMPILKVKKPCSNARLFAFIEFLSFVLSFRKKIILHVI
ncbi:MAG: hypothetical protein K0S53_3371 [Bacteroidetes bacterium]|nr:hypothetical protein [Bacteroidota bacterium]